MKLSIFVIVLIGAVLAAGNANADVKPAEERALRDPGTILKNAMNAGISGGKAAIGAAVALGQHALGLVGRADMEPEERNRCGGMLRCGPPSK